MAASILAEDTRDVEHPLNTDQGGLDSHQILGHKWDCSDILTRNLLLEPEHQQIDS